MRDTGAIEASIALRSSSRKAVRCAGTPAMAPEQDKIHFAIAIFHDAARLAAVLHDFRLLGLGENEIWLGGKTPPPETRLDRSGGVNRDSVVIGTLPSGEVIYGTDGKAHDLMQTALCQNGKSCLRAILEGDIGATLEEIASGAIILTARAADPSLQDQSMRILLRHSQHMVYSRECRQQLTINIRRPDN